MNALAGLTQREGRKLLIDAAVSAVELSGYIVTRLPGRGRYSVYTVEQHGRRQKACIRTTRDRLIAFPPAAAGRAWKTLDNVDYVIVSAVDSKATPRNVEVYMFAAADVRSRFNEAYRARKQQGVFTGDKFGFWLRLDKSEHGNTYRAGSGIVADMPNCRIAVYKIAELVSSASKQRHAVEPPFGQNHAIDGSIGDVMLWARKQVAALAGVNADAVKLDMKVEY